MKTSQMHCIIVSIILTACYFIFTEPLLTLFGGKVNEGTYANAREYFFYITLGIPVYIVKRTYKELGAPSGKPAAKTV